MRGKNLNSKSQKRIQNYTTRGPVGFSSCQVKNILKIQEVVTSIGFLCCKSLGNHM